MLGGRPGHWLSVVRCGQEAMAQRKQKTVLFLCTGNYYRSRFAEVLFNSVAERMELPWKALSKVLALERECQQRWPDGNTGGESPGNAGRPCY
jgi:hypothetical protein